jgi:hypothetical protein
MAGPKAGHLADHLDCKMAVQKVGQTAVQKACRLERMLAELKDLKLAFLQGDWMAVRMV